MTVFSVLRRIGRQVGLPAAVAALLVGCGGGTSQIQAFKPSRLIIFGDEEASRRTGFEELPITATATSSSLLNEYVVLPSR